MKNYMLLSLLMIPLLLTGQAERIYSIAVKKRPKAYFVEQAGLWEQEVEKTNTADAWLNYYRAARMSNLLTSGKDKPYDLQALMDAMAAEIPGTFEYHHVRAWDGGYTEAAWEHLLRAYELAPDRPETYDQFVAFYNKKGDVEKRRLFNRKIYEAGDYSPGMLRWNYNMLMSVEENGILITHGDGDTYPGWMLQDVHGIRRDMLIDNFYLLRDEDYRRRLFSELGVPPLSGNKRLIDSFALAQQNSSIGDFHKIDSAMQALSFPANNVAGKLLLNATALEENLNEWINVQQVLNEELSYADSVDLENQKQQLIHTLDSLMDKTEYLLSQQESHIAVQRPLAQIDNSNIVTTESYEQNTQTVNTIYLKTIANGSSNFSSTEITDLYNIANQCPLAGGDAVWLARSLYSLINDQLTYDDATLCASSTSNSEVKEQDKLQLDERLLDAVKQNEQTVPLYQFRLQPNPSKDQVQQ